MTDPIGIVDVKPLKPDGGEARDGPTPHPSRILKPVAEWSEQAGHGLRKAAAMVLDLKIGWNTSGKRITVTDEYGGVRYVVRAEERHGSGKTFRMYAGEGEDASETATILQDGSGATARFDVSIDGRTAATVAEKSTLFSTSYVMDGIGLVAKESSWGSTYTVMRGDEAIARFRKPLLSDAYEASIPDESDAVPVVALILAIAGIQEDAEITAAAAVGALS